MIFHEDGWMSFSLRASLNRKEGCRTMTSLPPEDRYSLTLHMHKRYQRTLKIAAVLAKEMGIIEEATITQLMNLFVNLGLEYLRSEALK